MAYDVREIANLVLEIADGDQIPVTNLDINKIVYFLHGWYLAKTGNPLVSAKIEAWRFGPVFRELYSQFADVGSQPISFRATRRNTTTLEKEVCYPAITTEEFEFLEPLVHQYIRIKTSILVDLSHVPGGPWDKVFNHDTDINPGMEITNDAI